MLWLTAFMVFPLFGDDIASRRLIRNTYVPLACLAVGVALANVNDARPHIGHLAGVTGVLKYQPFNVLLFATVSGILAYPVALFLESSATWVWRLIRESRG